MLKVIVTGGTGQLATAIAKLCTQSKNSYIITSIEELDICSVESVSRGLQDADIVINCAAYTNVEAAEENIEEATRINRDGVANIAKVARERGIKLIHISTDFVFGGDNERTTPYSEQEAPSPINVYGKTKAEGEAAALTAPGAIVLRTSWLYAPWGHNFVNTIIGRARQGAELRVVDDQRGTPTSAISLAQAIIEIIESGAWQTMEGIYHYSDLGESSWYDFAKEILRIAEVETRITPCKSSEWQSKAKRPHYSVLDKSRIAKLGIVALKPWQEQLREVITYKE
ncbi:MAG: dTDP-4-dehydrorhamnose reductase [Alistipes sp.]|nr:dTDP-4-dehydrorhamnose reductase [Alistipes sp.]